jgi:hypothetical protein
MHSIAYTIVLAHVVQSAFTASLAYAAFCKFVYVRSQYAVYVLYCVNPMQDYIDSLMPTVSQLGQVSTLLANSIASQDELLNSVNSKTEQTSDATMAVTRKAAKLTGTSNKEPILLKGVALLHKQSGKYLSVQGSSVVLQHTEVCAQFSIVVLIYKM